MFPIAEDAQRNQSAALQDETRRDVQGARRRPRRAISIREV